MFTRMSWLAVYFSHATDHGISEVYLLLLEIFLNLAPLRRQKKSLNLRQSEFVESCDLLATYYFTTKETTNLTADKYLQQENKIAKEEKE